MAKAQQPNFHEDEVAVVAAVSSDTRSVLEMIRGDLGELAPATMAQLKAALNDLLTILLQVREQAGDKKNALTLNRSLVDFTVLKIPSPAVPDVGGVSQTINQVVSNHTSIDLLRLQQSVAIAQNVRVPSEVTDFEKRKIALVSAKLDSQISGVALAQDNVNSMIAAIE